MDCSKQEFKTGDIVHFKAYEKKIQARVLKVITPAQSTKLSRTDYEYELEGISEPLVSLTSGRSILESEYYTP
jgi:hypothetical protein